MCCLLVQRIMKVIPRRIISTNSTVTPATLAISMDISMKVLKYKYNFLDCHFLFLLLLGPKT